MRRHRIVKAKRVARKRGFAQREWVGAPRGIWRLRSIAKESAPAGVSTSEWRRGGQGHQGPREGC